MAALTSFDALQDFALIASAYRSERAKRPDVPAVAILNAIRKLEHGDAFSMEEALCERHEFAYTGTAYGGDDDRFSGEGRCYCIHCGLDGDA